MEILIRLGADKRKAKQIVELQRDINRLNEQIRDLKLDNDLKGLKIEKLNRSIEYYKKKVGKTSGKISNKGNERKLKNMGSKKEISKDLS